VQYGSSEAFSTRNARNGFLNFGLVSILVLNRRFDSVSVRVCGKSRFGFITDNFLFINIFFEYFVYCMTVHVVCFFFCYLLLV